MEIVRKQLSSNEIQPVGTRWNGATDTVQQTPDDGTTWNDAPQLDPRRDPAYQLPPRGGSDPKCDAAANMLAKLKTMVLIFESEIAVFQAATALLAIILVFLPGVGIVVDALLAIADLLVTLGASAISTAFTDEQWDLILCILDCEISDDGTVNENQFNAIISDIFNQCDTVVYDVMYTLLPGLGWVGLTNAGATGEETGDCSACDCPPRCHEWSNVGSTAVDATYTRRTFQSTLTPNVTFTRITIDWQLNPNPGATLVQADVRVWLSGSGLPQYTFPILDVTGEAVINFEPASTEDEFIIQVRSYYSGGSNYPDLTLVRFEYLPDPDISWAGGSDC